MIGLANFTSLWSRRNYICGCLFFWITGVRQIDRFNKDKCSPSPYILQGLIAGKIIKRRVDGLIEVRGAPELVQAAYFGFPQIIDEARAADNILLGGKLVRPKRCADLF